ncbi:hypothetical protein Bca52824_039050 [Brassica carinata]|uniref:Uncharacterized protein n=1 Tax=Brassica carinata TaxID=52824 RepID=A0A8X7UWJ3_BRACI|nr:hypothetical protein Bca52824_039050 [Brassica carinata]
MGIDVLKKREVDKSLDDNRLVKGMPLNVLGVGVGGGCGVGLGLGWGFGTAFGSHYRSSRLTFQGVELEKDGKVENMSKNA